MKTTIFISKHLLFAGLMLMNLLTCPAVKGDNFERSKDDRTASPYFFVKGNGSETEAMPLKETSAEVNIAGVIADVKVKQTYKNEGKTTIEAIYVFPGSTRAAVYAMEMKIGERTIKAKIEEKGKARKDYDEAKNAGKSASLLEQQRPNVFQMNVANILPGDVISVELRYTELLVPESGVYSFVYPTVVGPRYQSAPDNTTASIDKMPLYPSKPIPDWVDNPYLHSGEKPNYTFNIMATVRAGLPIKDFKCESHEVNVNFKNKSEATVSLKASDAMRGNKDFVLQYRLAGNKVESGVLLFEGEKENYFLAMIQPPKRVLAEQIPPREYIFIVDVSGSMYGFPLEISKKLLKDLIGGLRPSDMFNVILFAGGNSVMAENSLPTTNDNIKKAIHLIDKQQGGGATEIIPALRRALAMPKTEGFSRSVVIATDGYVTVEKEAFDIIRNNLDQSNFFAFGIGTAVNRFLIEGMAHAGMSESFVITDGNQAAAVADKFRDYVQNPVLTNIHLSYSGLNTYDVEPPKTADVFADRPVIVFGKYHGKAAGKIMLSGKTGNEDYNTVMDISTLEASTANVALRYLWARHRIQRIDDYQNLSPNDTQVKELTQLGLDYNLLTAYTSFIGIDEMVRGDGKSTTIKQPLPLPEGVSDYAVGKGGSSQTMGYASPASAPVYYNKGAENYDYSTMETSQRVQSENASLIKIGKLKKEVQKREKEEKAPAAISDTTAAMEQMAQFPGGDGKLLQYLKNNLQYPASAKQNNITGTVYVQFVIDKNGNIKDAKVVKSVSKELDEEALRLIKAMPKWIPGTKGGKATDVQYTLPVKFGA